MPETNLNHLARKRMLKMFPARAKASVLTYPTEAELKLEDEICTLNLVTNLDKVLF